MLTGIRPVGREEHVSATPHEATVHKETIKCRACYLVEIRCHLLLLIIACAALGNGNGQIVENMAFKEKSDYVYTKGLLGGGVEYITVDGVNISNPAVGSHCVAPNDCWEIINATRHLIAYGPLVGSDASFTVYPESTAARSPIGIQYKSTNTQSYQTLAGGVKPVFAKELLKNEKLIHILLFNTDIGNVNVSRHISTKGRFSDVITIMGKTGVQKKDLVLFRGHLGTENRRVVKRFKGDREQHLMIKPSKATGATMPILTFIDYENSFKLNSN
ncbi:hypothetical protein AAHC03_017090 [Spirometra sp. Aus1]